MSLRYKLFGIPGNLDEFVNAAKRKGIKKCDLILSSKNYSDVHYFEVVASAERIRLKIGEYNHLGFGSTRVSAEQEGLMEGIKTAERLCGLGFKVTANDESIDKAREAFAKSVNVWGNLTDQNIQLPIKPLRKWDH